MLESKTVSQNKACKTDKVCYKKVYSASYVCTKSQVSTELTSSAMSVLYPLGSPPVGQAFSSSIFLMRAHFRPINNSVISWKAPALLDIMVSYPSVYPIADT